MLLSLSAMTAGAAYIFSFGILSETEKTATITSVTDTGGGGESLAIPARWSINGVEYSIVKISDNAIENLPELRRVTIPSTITAIGTLNQFNLAGNINNFDNCPELTAITIVPGNMMFQSDQRGILYCAGSSIICKCPAKVATASGKLTFNSQPSYDVNKGAFNNVTSVTSLEFNSIDRVEENGGLNTMPWLSEVNVTSSASPYKSKQGVLIDDKNRIVTFPPRKMLGNYTPDPSVKAVGYMAFANTFYLSTINLANVTSVESYAFINSRIKNVVFHSPMKYVGHYALYNCKELSGVWFEDAVEAVPDYFAAECPKLTAVNYASVPAKIGRGAFRNCEALVSHPFSYSHLGDSTFYNTGFTEVVYQKFSTTDHPLDMFGGRWAFADCRNIKTLDMSAIDTTEKDRMIIQGFFMSGCGELEKVVLPSYTKFSQLAAEDGICPAFKGTPKLKTIITGAINRGVSPIFSYDGDRTYRPDVYVKISDLPDVYGTLTPFKYLWQSTGKAVIRPIFYWESTHQQPLSVYDNGSYYVPGGCLENFSEAIDAGCFVEEFYRLRLANENGCLAITTTEVYPDMVKMISIKVDNAVWKSSSYGSFNTGIPFSTINDMWITYTVHGVEFTTRYDRSFIQIAGIDDIEADPSDAAPRYYNLQGVEVSVPRPGHIYIVKRGSAVTKEILH